MAVDLHGVTTVLLPGTGSDDDYVRRAFTGPLREVGALLVAPPPRADRLIDGYLSALDDAARDGPICVGGVSIGAAVAAAWALAHPDRTIAVLAALPAWAGAPGTAPAALAAWYSAERLRVDGLAATTTQMRASSPSWLDHGNPEVACQLENRALRELAVCCQENRISGRPIADCWCAVARRSLCQRRTEECLRCADSVADLSESHSCNAPSSGQLFARLRRGPPTHRESVLVGWSAALATVLGSQNLRCTTSTGQGASATIR